LVVSSAALVDHLQAIILAKDRGGDLNAAGAPAVGHRHFAGGKRHLVSRDRDALQDRAADHPLGLFVEIGEIVFTLIEYLSRGVHCAALRSSRILR
jgi:hypothetical protein